MQILKSYDDDFLPRVPAMQHRRGRHRRVSSYCCGGVSLSPQSLISRNSFSYDVLPQIPLKLTICKLDGSYFEVEVAKTATTEELKQAVEEVFTNKRTKGHNKISWAHVWGHFCLCYDGWKLLADTECISDYMINDGDRLYFVQHVSVDTYSIRKQSKEEQLTSEESKMPSSWSNCFLETKKNIEKEELLNDHGNSPSQYGIDENKNITMHYECKFSQILGRWFSYRRLGNSQKRTKSRDFSSKVADGFSGGFKSIMRLCSSNKINSRRDNLEEI